MKLPNINLRDITWRQVCDGLWRYGVLTFLVAYLVIKVIVYWVSGDQPTPVNPPDGYVSHDARVRVAWSPSGQATSYQLEVAENGDFSNPVYTLKTGITAARLPPLEPGKRYCWRVLASDSARISCFHISDIQVLY